MTAEDVEREYGAGDVHRSVDEGVANGLFVACIIIVFSEADAHASDTRKQLKPGSPFHKGMVYRMRPVVSPALLDPKCTGLHGPVPNSFCRVDPKTCHIISRRPTGS